MEDCLMNTVNNKTQKKEDQSVIENKNVELDKKLNY
jgi:hypothetical protein